MGLSKLVAASVLVFVLAGSIVFLALSMRYDLIVVVGEYRTEIFRIDRLTGQMEACDQGKYYQPDWCGEVQFGKPSPDE